MRLQKTILDDCAVYGWADEYIYETIKQNHNFYESELLKKWLPYMQRSSIILDIGANIGNHSLFWSLYTEAKAIYAFEPLKENFLVLQKNIQENNLDNLVYCVNKAVGNENSQVSIKSLDISNMGSTVFEKTEKTDQSAPLITIDSFVKEHENRCVDFIKIDTEGFEISVIEGMQEVIKQCYPTLWIEVSGKTEKIVRDILEKNDYKLIDISGANFLAMHPSRDSSINAIVADEIMPQYFEHLEKRVSYYQLYIKVRDEQRKLLDSYRKVQENQKGKEEQFQLLKKKHDDLKRDFETKSNEKLEVEKNYQLLKKKHDDLKRDFETKSNEKLEVEKNYQLLLKEHQKSETIKSKLSAALASTRAVEEKMKELVYTMETDLSMQDRKINDLQHQIAVYENSFKWQIKLMLKNMVSRLRKFGIRHPLAGKIMQKTYRTLKRGYDKLLKK